MASTFGITGVFGEWGTGKTAFLAERIHEKRRQGYYIVSNFSHLETNRDCSTWPTDKFVSLLKQIVTWKSKGREMVDIFPEFHHTGVFIAVDEGHLYFNKVVEDSEFTQALLVLFSQVRKQDVEIMYTSQEPDKISIDWRRYTKVWIRLMPVVKWYKKIPVLFKTSMGNDCVRWETRLKIPWYRIEYHELDYKNPKFNLSTVKDEDGFSHWSRHSTIKSRSWPKKMNKFVHTLYDSNQVLAVDPEEKEGEFDLLKEFDLVPSLIEREPVPTFKDMLRLQRFDKLIPNRYRVGPDVIDLKSIKTGKDGAHNLAKQKIIHIDKIQDFMETPYKRFISKFYQPKA